jgi:hypothetical protein
MATPDLSAQLMSEIANLSAKALAGNITDEELRQGLKLLREERNSIKPAKKSKAADPEAELASLL